MTETALELTPQELTLTQGVVRAAQGPTCLVADHQGLRSLRVAASCLLAPQPGDLVLVARGEGGGHVLAVLESAQTGPARLEFPQGVSLSGPSLDLAGQEISVSGGGLTVGVERLSVLGRVVRANLEAVRLVGRSLEALWDRVSARMGSHQRQVEGLDQVEAGTYTRQAQGLMTLHSEYTVVTAEEDVKVDGQYIHLA